MIMGFFNYKIIVNLLLILKIINGTPYGMVSCAWGSHENTYITSKSDSMRDRNATLYAVKENDIKFLLYKIETPYPYQIFINEESRLINGNFDVTKPTKIIIHGYGSSYKSNSCVILRDAFLKTGDFNIIIVDWNRAQHWGINHIIPETYPAVVKKLKDVAAYLTQMIRFLESYGMDLSTTTIIGHSLGAHLAGIASHNLKNKVNRIVGLDPAGPYFENKVSGERLSKEDATYVEVIHTDIQECGLINQIGHYDFYPNRGIVQPGCEKHKCSHSRSYRFFAESVISPGAFYARKCSDWKSLMDANCDGDLVIMGGLERTPIPEGIYYLKTNSEFPYGMGRPQFN